MPISNKKGSHKITIRPLKTEEISILKDFLYYAIFQREGAELLPKSIIEEPDLAVYIKDFGNYKDDYCLVDEEGGQIVGACWVRIINGFGSVDGDTPEFAISVRPENRNKGIGTLLMRAMLKYLQAQNIYQKTSLAVQKDNYALRMYQKVGFTIIDENEEEFIMIHELKKA
ncbi:GNAT family N-acetyltransferase [Xylocopilactobacillus apicola]|uniref:N-acetyltransferase n=1 Tax=Xylocopilactobacillus apicola TaxID=2932184 RepID=A0AAU9DDD9_9LACO|nr:N-acetyltransferase [Xylocopilactobacillus apicola]BDR57825.1 N-acetyltransferase [Xylocopilactobacillus apicola]